MTRWFQPGRPDPSRWQQAATLAAGIAAAFAAGAVLVIAFVSAIGRAQ